MDILVTGSTGMIGSALMAPLTGAGHRVVRLLRAGRAGAEPTWDPARGRIDLTGAGPLDAAIHLAGENVAGGRWTAARKARIADSRLDGTRLLATALAERPRKPQVLISASAIGYYGDRGEELLPETAAPGEGFLAELTRDWEAATAPAAAAGIRVVCLRFGMVLGAGGGALRRMRRPFRWCLGGVIGSGRQYVSWVALDEVPRIVLHALSDGGLAGAVNVVTPNAVTNRQFTKTLGRVLHRPTLAHMPGWAARALFGEMAKPLLLASARAVPAVLTERGYAFEHPDLEGALRHIMGR